MLPRVILHNGVSVDGRMDWFNGDIGLYYELTARWPIDAILSGSGTMLAAYPPGVCHKVRRLPAVELRENRITQNSAYCPVGVITTVPAEALMDTLSIDMLAASVGLASDIIRLLFTRHSSLIVSFCPTLQTTDRTAAPASDLDTARFRIGRWPRSTSRRFEDALDRRLIATI